MSCRSSRSSPLPGTGHCGGASRTIKFAGGGSCSSAIDKGGSCAVWKMGVRNGPRTQHGTAGQIPDCTQVHLHIARKHTPG